VGGPEAGFGHAATVKPPDWSKVDELFHAALQRGDAEREAFLAEACRGNEELRREVLSLLEACGADAERMMEEPAADAARRTLAVVRGTRLGPYEVMELIGSGGMGEVYRARDVRLLREVAIKVLPEDFSRDPVCVSRFEREARLLAALNHPNIAAIHGLEEGAGQHALVLELVPGVTLAQRLSLGPLSVSEALRIFRQVADALEGAHEKGIIHRDLKPSNVAVTPDGHVKLLDFGLAKAFEEADSVGDTTSPTVSDVGTRQGLIMGTVSYMSPEQARGQALDERTDIWSFGCCLYEALTGRRAYKGKTASDTLAAVLEHEVDWAALPEETPASLRRLLLRCLQKDQSRRLHSIADARMEIEDAQGQGSGDSASMVTTAATTRSGISALLTPKRRLRPYAWVLLLLLAGVAIWQVWTLMPPRPPETGKSVAVLPLVTLGGEPDDEYFGTGLTEDIVTHLSKIPDLHVASSLSSLRYRGTDKGLREIGQELGVATFLVGKIRRQADRFRVNVELIDAATSRNLWAEVFEGQMSDIFAIQSEIAQKLAARLQVRLSTETEKALVRAPTIDPEAYQLALRGRYLRSREMPEDLVNATACFEQAIKRDSGYALAWAGLAEVYFLQAFLYTVHESQPALFEKATKTVERALDLDGTLAEAHVVKGILLAYHTPGGDAAAGERELRRAIELNPRLANAHRELGVLLLRSMGRVQEALDELLIADELEPFWVLTKYHLLEANLEKGDLASAVRMSREIRELDQTEWRHLLTAWISVALQDFGRAGRFVEEIVDQNRPEGLRLAALFLSLNGRTAEASALVDRALQIESHLVGPLVVRNHSTAGIVALFSGEYPAAARHLERANDLAPDPVGWSTFQYSTLYLDYATLLGYARLKTGDRGAALRLFEETERHYTERIARGDTSFRARVGIAAVHALRGDREAAYRWLQRAIDAGFYAYAELEPHPCFASIRGEERFRRMMDGVRARVEEIRRRVDAAEP
jgi:serine/threonine protein kinase/TolB-like protein/Tfp pilus assembly protein PilF